MESRSIGQYRVLAKLGQGGMGAVYSAEHAVLGKQVALKVLLPEMSQKGDNLQRFFNEAKAASRVAHPGIRDVYDMGETEDGSAYIVMQLLHGESLGKRLKRGPLAIEIAIALARQIAGGLHAAHQAGIVHRDMKPDNIFLVRDPDIAIGERAKILDFGIAKLRDTTGASFTNTDLIMGTPTFMAPEQCRGVRDVGPQADLYALGCVLFAMVTGRPPFREELIGDILAAHMLRPPPRLRSLVPSAPEGLEEIVDRMLAKHPQDRQPSLEHVAAELDRLETDRSGPVWQATTSAEEILTSSALISVKSLSKYDMATRPVRRATSRAEIETTPDTLSNGTGESMPEPPKKKRNRVALFALLGASLLAGAVIARVARGTPPAADPHATTEIEAPAPRAAAMPAPTPAPTPAPPPAAPAAAVPVPPPAPIPAPVAPAAAAAPILEVRVPVAPAETATAKPTTKTPRAGQPAARPAARTGKGSDSGPALFDEWE